MKVQSSTGGSDLLLTDWQKIIMRCVAENEHPCPAGDFTTFSVDQYCNIPQYRPPSLYSVDN